MVVKDYINKIKKDYEKIFIFRNSRDITNVEEHMQIFREYTQLSKGEFNQEALIEYLKNTDKNMRQNRYEYLLKYASKYLFDNIQIYYNMNKKLAKITDKYVQRGIPRDDAQQIMEESLSRILEENVKRMKDEYPNILSECGIAVINF